ncbi:hypothetical protein ASPWEDRAFT_171444 [Aspergillus wentii DTO 134E9]|uniref:Lysine-specific metallo-endopeptidase domain-containing protein n=1 Tax=Aspergillus wentii DTO 134E9 TaxID=1073089 RepID=A0A1L9RSQ9_ASPWE|nr:uncharacterized protein ASPWEDRAFT_171444 [Aspergillus wentii DTO 134E9]KAI9930813.1 hypothetical protein MW887_011571 [Aspergillus wentii]OJJ37991.1 hypothetical protein ASPWEDRAFT_171444 [Aspergillus wentii DTO 134E9]
MLTNTFLSLLLTGAAVASPTFSISKRANPTIKGYNDQHKKQIEDGFADAINLATYPQTIPAARVDPILKKYFHEKDKNTVIDVFKKITGDLTKGKDGSATLGDLHVVIDYPDPDDNNVLACDGDTMAELRGIDEKHPKLIICEGAGFGHGGVSKGYHGVKAIDCGYLDEEVSWKMETMGSILIHEYTHFTNLVVPPLKDETDDIKGGYGPHGARHLNKDKATNNADNYSWFAAELFWSEVCGKSFKDPTEKSSEDPHCGGQVCQATKGKPKRKKN